MSKKAAILKALKDRSKKIAFMAAMYDLEIITWPAYKQASKEHAHLQAEIKRLEGEKKQIPIAEQQHRLDK